MVKTKRGLGLEMMTSAEMPDSQDASGAQAQREPALRGRKRRIDARLDSIIEFANMQTRDDFDPENNFADAAFVESIREDGVLVPVAVIPAGDDRSREFKLVYGHRRYAASKYLGLLTIPADKYPANTPEEIIDKDAIKENTQRSDLSPLALAKALRKFKDKHGASHAELSRLAGLSKGHVSKVLSLLDLPAEVREFIKTYDVQVNTAYKLTKLSGAELEAALEAIRNSLPVEAAIEASSSRGETSPAKPAPSAKRNNNSSRYRITTPAALENTRKDLAGSKLKDLKARELVVLSQIRTGDKTTWRERIKQIRRLPKPALRDTGKALDQIMRIHSYASILGKDQVQLLLKALLIYLEKLLGDLEKS
ncbi:MAG: ParB/RepB/Spo0J family partition protein [Anaerolineales bacterium]